MNISKKKFVIIFIISAFAFMFVSNALFGTEPRIFPQPPESWLGADPQIGWRSVGYQILLPIKVVLIGPMLFTGDFLRQDPPPPFVAIVFTFYWLIFVLIIYSILGNNAMTRLIVSIKDNDQEDNNKSDGKNDDNNRDEDKD